MAHWGTESGILRKNKVKETHEDLLVFGYACKLFRDDDRAAYIDKGKHLIPWMGDEKLKIDRYDCRGPLSDISQYEASREGFDTMRWLGLDESERKLEQLCDKERYHSLHINEQEEEMYKEEEAKRQKANEFQYSYDVPSDPALAQKEIGPAAPEPEEEDEDYVPLPQLDVPVDIALPKTVKENARIEKTALFICKQGPQMEILIKAKQADNPQFGFLNQGNSLYKYYRHVLSAIKSGRYQVQTPKTEEKKDDASDANDGHYLHPSLVSTAQPDVQTSSIPSVPYKPSANCSYTQLVSKIQGGAAAVPVAEPPQQQQGQEGVPVALKMGGSAEMTYEQQQQQQQYYHYYYAAQYYEYYKQLAQYQQGGGDQPGQAVRPPETQLDPAMQNYIQQMAYAQYMQHQQNSTQNSQNPYAQIVSNVNKDVPNPYAQLLANMQQDQQQQPKPISKDPVIYTEEPKVVVTLPEPQEVVAAAAAAAPVAPQVGPVVLPKSEVAKAEVGIKKPLLSLAMYGSDSESEEGEEMEKSEEKSDEEKKPNSPFNSPTGEVQVVIDKMAMYVSKNGVQFEQIVKSKGDPRFDFLNDNHEFNKYYRSKIKEFQSVTEEKKAPTPPKVKEKKVITPVCFSIKKPKEDAPKEIKSALPMEESDDEEQGSSSEKTATPTTPVTPVTTSIIPAVVAKENESSEASSESSTTTTTVIHKNGLIDPDDPLLEMIDLTEDLEEKKDLRRAEDKIKDKLAAAAREKMVSVARDRALQLERKKKAAAFLKLMSAESNNAGPEEKKVEAKKDEERVMVVTENKDKEKMKSPVKSSRSTSKSPSRSSRSKSRSKDKDRDKRDGKDVVEVSDSGTEEGDRRRRSSKRKKSHKEKRSKSKHSEDKKSKKKSKRKRRRSDSESSNAS